MAKEKNVMCLYIGQLYTPTHEYLRKTKPQYMTYAGWLHTNLEEQVKRMKSGTVDLYSSPPILKAHIESLDGEQYKLFYEQLNKINVLERHYTTLRLVVN